MESLAYTTISDFCSLKRHRTLWPFLAKLCGSGSSWDVPGRTLPSGRLLEKMVCCLLMALLCEPVPLG